MLLVRVHPNLGGSYGVLQEVGSRIGGLFGEHVAHVRAGVNLQTPPTLPHLRATDTRRTVDDIFWLYLSYYDYMYCIFPSFILFVVPKQVQVIILYVSIFGVGIDVRIINHLELQVAGR